MAKSRSMVTRARLNKCEAARKSAVKKIKTAEKKVKKHRRSKPPVKQSRRKSPKKSPAKKRTYKKKSMSKQRHAGHSYFAMVYPKKAKSENRKYKSRKSPNKSPTNKRRYKKMSKSVAVKKVKAGSSQDAKKQMRKEMKSRVDKSTAKAVKNYGSGKGGKTGDV